MLKFIENLLFPVYCSICGVENINGMVLCDKCRWKLRRTENIFPGGYDPQYSGTRYFDKLKSVFIYDRNLQKLMYKYKSLGRKNISDYFISELIRSIDPDYLNADYITYVPVHWRKKITRGFDQSAVIAYGLAKITGINMACFLKKNVVSGPQKEMDFTWRHINALGAYSINTGNMEVLQGTTVLLVDDIFTTGSTLNECSRILKKNGANRVFSLTVGVTDNKK